MFAELESQGVPAAYAARWLALLEERGISPERALEGTGLTRAMVEDPAGRLGLGAVAMLLANGTQLADDPALGLELGLELKPTSHGPLGVALISCDSLGDAIRLGERYMTQRSLPWGIRLVVEGDTAVMQFVENISLGPMRMLVLELVLGGVVRLGELMLDLSFAHPDIEFWADYPEQPHHARFHPRLPRVRYEQPMLCARFPASWLSRPLSWREPVAKRAAVAALEDERRLLVVEGADFVERTRALLADPKNRYPDLDEASSRLHVSGRTLRRHLQKQNLTFHALRDEARRSRAMQLLSQSLLAVEEIASELGYADAAGFIRAFARWTGQTPAAYRRKSRARAE
ncbi:MAG: AraC family transcriptional regulator ligand-binding domain-containing protein [Polyangiales bacterium]